MTRSWVSLDRIEFAGATGGGHHRCHCLIALHDLRTADLLYTSGIVSTHPASQSEPEHLELPIEELLRRAHPLPDHDEMVIEDLSEEEGEAFLSAVQS